jgi:hypothetical protein
MAQLKAAADEQQEAALHGVASGGGNESNKKARAGLCGLLRERKVVDLARAKRRLVEVPYTATLAHTANALLAARVSAVAVAAPPGHWIGAGGSMILESDPATGAVRKHYIGMVNMLDILAHIAEASDDDEAADLDRRMAVPVSSVIGHSLEGLTLWTLHPSTRYAGRSPAHTRIFLLLPRIVRNLRVCDMFVALRQRAGLHGDVQQGCAPRAGAAGELGGQRGGAGAGGVGAGVPDAHPDGRGEVPQGARRGAQGRAVAHRARARRRERHRVRRLWRYQGDRRHQGDAGGVADRRARRGRRR